MMQSLLLFEDSFPCWDEETFALAGEEPQSLIWLTERGLVEKRGDGCILTPEGETERLKCAQEMGVPALPIRPFDPDSALWNNGLYLLMDRAFVGQYGVKEFSVDEELPVVPNLSRGELWAEENGCVRYVWPQQPVVKSFLNRFPHWGVAARRTGAPGDGALRQWAEKEQVQTGFQRFNLVLRNRYDFELYRKEPRAPEDIFRMKDADRFFFVRTSDKSPDEIFDVIGRLHMFMLAQRRVYIPGYADIDSQEQENWTLLVLTADTEEELESVCHRFSREGKNLIEPANPLFIIGTSVERLRRQKTPEDTAYDWFCNHCRHIVRPDV
ncbi:MAG: hypothetical protein SOZ52_06855 [Pyramidobacter sp.]|nr:hypothetical protein [Pyramidobacter sp.]